MSELQTFLVSSSGQMSLPAAARHRWNLDDGGPVDVLDLEWAVLTMPKGKAAELLDRMLPADVHYARVASDSDPDLQTT